MNETECGAKMVRIRQSCLSEMSRSGEGLRSLPFVQLCDAIAHSRGGLVSNVIDAKDALRGACNCCIVKRRSAESLECDRDKLRLTSAALVNFVITVQLAFAC
jgi:hypothetical protein